MKLPWRFDKLLEKSYLVNNLQILLACNTILLIKLMFLNLRQILGQKTVLCLQPIYALTAVENWHYIRKFV